MAEIETLDGYTVLVDELYVDLLISGHGWRTMVVGNHPNGMDNGARYAYTKQGRKMVLMHRLIMNAGPGEQVVHLNRNGLDNRRSNLFIGKAPSCPLRGIVAQRHRNKE
jgi:hypothetical protein